MAGKSRRNNNDRFVTYMLVGFAVVIVGLVAGLLISNALKVTYEYDSFDYVTSYGDVTNMPEDQYIVYWYGLNCSHCNDIKQEVLEFADNNKAGIKVYLMDSSNATTGTNDIVDPDTGVAMTGTPSMIVVVDGVVVDVFVGSGDVPNLIDDINDGVYNRIN